VGWVLGEIIFQALFLGGALAGGTAAGAFQSLDPAGAVEVQIAGEGAFGPACPACDLVVGQPLAVEIEHLHLERNAGIGIVEAFGG
jgi:hypothetical protein